MRPHDLLAVPLIYEAFGRAIGVSRVRTVLAAVIRTRPGDRLLDLGCGPGSMRAFLPGVDYTGVDANPQYIAVARRRFPDARFICNRIGGHLVRGERFDVVVAAGVLHHLDDDDAVELLRLAKARLRAGGRLVTLDTCFVEGAHPVARWLARRDRGHHVRQKHEQVRLVEQVFPTAAATLHHDLLRFPYTHLVMDCTAS